MPAADQRRISWDYGCGRDQPQFITSALRGNHRTALRDQRPLGEKVCFDILYMRQHVHS